LSPIAPNYFIPEWLSTSNFHICLRFLGYVYTASGLSNYDGLKQRLPAGLFGPFQTDAKFPRAEDREIADLRFPKFDTRA
jgi:hypothetical protein